VQRIGSANAFQTSTRSSSRRATSRYYRPRVNIFSRELLNAGRYYPFPRFGEAPKPLGLRQYLTCQLFRTLPFPLPFRDLLQHFDYVLPSYITDFSIAQHRRHPIKPIADRRRAFLALHMLCHELAYDLTHSRLIRLSGNCGFAGCFIGSFAREQGLPFDNGIMSGTPGSLPLP